ncbi:hypothetical protein GCM10023189_27790 [Nibrella saemangeumensis]|uniref:Glycosyltransferase 2-like domain-containing protein n=1 Tax=Nibrella saemangeumensis TaxID=1084526 RepID=A0ABP8MWN6_9BACT
MESLAIIIPTFNRQACLRALLHQLASQQPVSSRVAIVVVVDGSTDGTLEMLAQEFPEVHRVLGDGSWWFTRSVNEGIRYAEESLQPDAFLILNDDSEIEPDYLIKLYQSAQAVEQPALMGSLALANTQPPMVTFSGNKSLTRWRLKSTSYLPHFCPFDSNTMTGVYPTYGLVGRGMLIPQAVIRRIGYLDEAAFPQYGSDDDYALTAHRQGIPVYISWDARVYTSEQLTSDGTAHRQQKLPVFLKSFRNRYSINSLQKQITFYRRHGIAPLWPLATLIFILGTFRAYLWKYRNIRV